MTPDPMSEFSKLISRLHRHHGAPDRPPAHGPFELVLWENACYLLPDDRRAAVFETLRRQGLLTAAALAGASDEVLLPLARIGGMLPETRVERWRDIARIALEEFAGDCGLILREP